MSIADIQREVAGRFAVRVRDMLSARATRSLTRPRQVAMYLARELTSLSYPAIGRRFARDHTTVMHGCRRVERLMAEDRGYAILITAIKLALESPVPRCPTCGSALR